MNKNIVLVAILLISNIVLGQNGIKDPEAKTILDQLAEETRSFETISADFSFTMENQQEDITETYEGKVILKGEKYRLNLMGTETYCNGETIWTFMVESEEVNITNRDPEDKSFLNNPSSIFTMYEEGYKYTHKGDIEIGEKNFAHIELYPEKVDQGLEPGDEGTTDLSKIKILIDTEANRIHTFTYFTKDGNVYTIALKNLKPNIEIADSDFTFDPNKHPMVEVIDLRD